MDTLNNIALLLRGDGLVSGRKLVILRAQTPIVVVFVVINLTSSRGIPYSLISVLVRCVTDMIHRSINVTMKQDIGSYENVVTKLPRELRFLRLPLDFFLELLPQSPSESLADDGVS